MDEYSLIISRIWRHIIIRDIPLAVLSLVMIGIIIYIIKKRLATKALVLFLLIMIVACISYIAIEIVVFKMEIANRAFVKYQGIYSYSTVIGADGDQINLLDENQDVRLHSLYMGIDDGTYKGNVVYTKWTKWVLEVE